MKRFIGVILLSLVFSLISMGPARGNSSKKSESDQIIFKSKATNMSEHAKNVKLNCSPRVLKYKDVLKISMSVPHGGDLLIRSPKGTVHIICWFVVEGEEIQPLYESKECSDKAEISITAGVTKSWAFEDPFIYGTIFKEPGIYTIRVGYNLEVQSFPGEVKECKVTYKP